MFAMLCLYCIAMLLRYLSGCDGPFMFKIKACFESDKLIKFFTCICFIFLTLFSFI